MVYTAVTVIIAGFLPGVLSAMAIYGVTYRFFDRSIAGKVLVEQGH